MAIHLGSLAVRGAMNELNGAFGNSLMFDVSNVSTSNFFTTVASSSPYGYIAYQVPVSGSANTAPQEPKAPDEFTWLRKRVKEIEWKP